MQKSHRQTIAAASGFTAVALGAFGAHALKALFSPYQQEIWEKAVFYQFIHTVVLLWLSREPAQSDRTFSLFLGGIILFCGSLFVLALTNLRWLGAVTPIGGLCFLAGWGMLIASSLKKEKS